MILVKGKFGYVSARNKDNYYKYIILAYILKLKKGKESEAIIYKKYWEKINIGVVSEEYKDL